VQRSHTLLSCLTVAAGCGSGPVGPNVTPTEPTQTHVVASTEPTEPIEPDAAVPEVIAPPSLACEPGSALLPAVWPEPTWACARPDGTRHGPFVTLHPDGTPAITGSHRDGKLHGAWQRYHPGGQLAEEGSYAGGVPDGRWRQYAPSGAALGEYELVAGTGTEKRWYDDGPLYRSRELAGGVVHGWWKEYARDGSLVASARLSRGKPAGDRAIGTKASLRIEESIMRGVRRTRQIWKRWVLLIDERFDARGRLDGKFTIRRDRRALRLQGSHAAGVRTGTWTWFDRNGTKEREGSYLAGKRTGTWSEWLDGKLASTASYAAGKPDGDFVFYDRAGNELGRSSLRGGTGTLVTYHATRQPASRTRYVKGLREGAYQELTVRGKVVVEGRYAGNRKHGWWRERTEAGTLVLEQHWRRDELDGVVRKYTAGQLASEATYKAGRPDGPYVEYRAGKPALTGRFADGVRTGTWTRHDPDDRVVLIATYEAGVLAGPWRQRAAGEIVEGELAGGRRTGVWKRTDRAGVTREITYLLDQVGDRVETP
jgi:uncharacterized protein